MARRAPIFSIKTILFIGHVLVLIACSKPQAVPVQMTQGQAQWKTPAQETKQKLPEEQKQTANIDYQKVWSELGIIHDPPISLQAKEIEYEIRKAQNQRLPFSFPAVKLWLEKLRSTDHKKSQEVFFGGRAPVHFKDESESFIQTFINLTSKKGTAQVPLRIKSYGEVESINEYFVDVEIGGDSIPGIELVTAQDISGQPCSNVLCALASLILSPSSEPTQAQWQDAENAAHLVLFNYYFNKYMIPFMVPKHFYDFSDAQLEDFKYTTDSTLQKISEDSGSITTREQKREVYQHRRMQFKIPDIDAIQDITETLWVLPPHFQGMKKLYAFFISSDPEAALGVERSTMVVDGMYSLAPMFHTMNNRPGIIIINKFLYPQKIDPGLIKMRRSKIAHEIAHAFDSSMPIQADHAFGPAAAPSDFKWGLSTSLEWTRLGDWRYKPYEMARTIFPMSFIKSIEPQTWNIKGHFSLNNEASTNFMIDYAKIDPSEDLAEHFRFSIFFPQETKEKVPLKYQFITEKMLSGWMY